VKHVAHDEHVGRGQRVGEEVARVEAQPVGEPVRLQDSNAGRTTGRSKPPPVSFVCRSASWTGTHPSAAPTSMTVR
jgi:hypothetical protein